MKKWLYVLLVIDIISLIIVFFSLLANFTVFALVAVLSGILGLVPLFALIHCLDCVEQQGSDISYLYYKLKKLEKEQGTLEEPIISPALKHSDSPKKTWKCIKCDTVNKAEDSVCQGCNAEYTYLNPTFETEPKRKSRFVKFK